jgi:hypothetical protein
MVLMTIKNVKNLQLTKICSQIAIYLSPGLHKGRPSYRRSLQPSKENIQHPSTLKHEISNFFQFLRVILPYGIQIRIHGSD